MSKCNCNKPLSGIPLGGIGTGSFEIRCDGNFHEWQIFNNPPWCGTSDYLKADNPPLKQADCSFVIRTREKNGITTRLLRAFEKEEMAYSYHIPFLKMIEELSWDPKFPRTTVSYSDSGLPVSCKLSAWSPFIPHDVKNSSLPAAILTFSVKNKSKNPVEVSLLGLLANPFKIVEQCAPGNTVKESDQHKSVVFSASGVPEKHPMARGELCLSVLGPGTTYDAAAMGGFRGVSFMGFYEDFYKTGVLPNNGKPPEPSAFEPVIQALHAGQLPLKDFYLQLPKHFRGYIEQAVVKQQKEFQEELNTDPLRFSRDMEARWIVLLRHAMSPDKLAIYETRIKKEPELYTNPVRLEEFLTELAVDDMKKSMPIPKSAPPQGSVCRTIALKPGQEEEITFVISWYFPQLASARGDEYMGHMYENWFSSSSDVAEYVMNNMPSLKDRTFLFMESLYKGTMPYWFKDAVNSQLTTMVKSSYYVKDGEFGIWEGLGCCGMVTLDVTYYGSFPLIHLFPELEKTQMRLTARYQMNETIPAYEEYFLAFPRNKAEFEKELVKDPALIHDREKRRGLFKKISVLTGYDPTGRIPHLFAGSFNRVDAYHMIDLMPKFALLVHRDWLWSGDGEFLKSMWPHVKSAIDHNIAQDEQGLGLPYHYGNEATDLPISSQTYDVWDFKGYSTYVCTIWLASLKSAEVMAAALGDGEYAEKMTALYGKALANLEKLLWNGEYYDLWNDPIHNQRNEFCMADQLSGQWYLNVLDLPPMLPRKKILSVLKAVARYNCLPDRGLVNGVLPKGKKAVWAEGLFGLPVNYQSDTPWTGTEYAVAALFIQEGLVDKGLAIAKDVYDRYKHTGMTWNHIECGEHYYRAMSIWNVYQALQGYKWDAVIHALAMSPGGYGKEHESLVMTPEGYGMFSLSGKGNLKVRIAWLSGKQPLGSLTFPCPSKPKDKSPKVTLNKAKLVPSVKEKSGTLTLTFAAPIVLQAGDVLTIKTR